MELLFTMFLVFNIGFLLIGIGFHLFARILKVPRDSTSILTKRALQHWQQFVPLWGAFYINRRKGRANWGVTGSFGGIFAFQFSLLINMYSCATLIVLIIHAIESIFI